jgi:hypothetical protein
MATDPVPVRYTVEPSQAASVLAPRSIRVGDADWKRFRMAALAADQTVAQFLITLLDAHEQRR